MQKTIILLTLMSLLSLTSCQESDAAENDPLPEDGNPVEVPGKVHMMPQLLGTWRDRWSLSTSSLIYTDLYNAEKNVWYAGNKSPWDMNPDPANGIYFDEKGNFIWVVLSSTRPYSGSGCWVHAVEFISGKADVKGNKITFYPSVRRQKYNSVCNPNQDYDQDIQTNSFEVTFEVNNVSEADGTKLKAIRLINPDQSFIEYYTY